MTRVEGCDHQWRHAGRAPIHRHDEAGGCERPGFLVCRSCGESRVIRCQSSSRAKCAPCSERYRCRVRRVAMTPMLTAGAFVFLTLTAPGSRLHRLPSGRVCPCTPPGGVDLATWNASLSVRWNRFVTDLRRTVGQAEYFRAVEVQRRGALHLHVVLRWEGSPRPLDVAQVRRLAIRHGFGHEVDAQVVPEADRPRVAGYLSKYVSKAATDRESVPFAGGGRWRTWTASWRWGCTMASVREAQRAWWLDQRPGAPGAPGAGGAGGPGDRALLTPERGVTQPERSAVPSLVGSSPM